MSKRQLFSKCLTRHGGLTVPNYIRTQLGWQGGDPMDLTINEDGSLYIKSAVHRCCVCTEPADMEIRTGKYICSECTGLILKCAERSSLCVH